MNKQASPVLVKSPLPSINGNPLQYSCLENPMDGGAWWAAIHGVAQSWTRLKRLNSSSSPFYMWDQNSSCLPSWKLSATAIISCLNVYNQKVWYLVVFLILLAFHPQIRQKFLENKDYIFTMLLPQTCTDDLFTENTSNAKPRLIPEDTEREWKLLSRVWLFATPWTIQSMEFSRQNTGVSSLSLLQGIFPTQGSNPCLPHCRWILYQLSHKGSPRIPEWVAYLFSSRSSQPRNQTGVSCIAGGFFTNWARRCIQIQSLEKLSIKWRWQICELMNLGRYNQFYRWVVEIQNMGNKFAQSDHINKCLI